MAKKNKSLDGLTRVELYSPSKDVKRKFGKDHCQNILRLAAKGKGDWQLVDEKLKFEDGIITRPSQGSPESSQE